MKSAEVAEMWEANAETWTRHARTGYDVYRDALNTPAFLAMLPPISDLHGLDVGCGEGSNTRELARLGARMHAIDVVPTFMSMMDMPDQGRALREAYRVLRPGGFLQFSILHPCFAPPHRRVLRNADGTTRAIEVGGYFDAIDGEVETWWTAPCRERKGNVSHR